MSKTLKEVKIPGTSVSLYDTNDDGRFNPPCECHIPRPVKKDECPRDVLDKNGEPLINARVDYYMVDSKPVCPANEAVLEALGSIGIYGPFRGIVSREGVKSTGTMEELKTVLELCHVLKNDKDMTNRMNAASRLALLAKENRFVGPLLREVFLERGKNPAEDIQTTILRGLAARGLGFMGWDEAIEPLSKILQNEEETYQLRSMVTLAFANMVNETGYGLEPLQNAATHAKDHRIRLAAVDALGTIEFNPPLDTLAYVLANDPEDSIRLKTAEILNTKYLSDEFLIEPFGRALMKDNVDQIRIYAAGFLGRISSAKGTGALGWALMNDRNDKVRFNAAFSLSSIGRHCENRFGRILLDLGLEGSICSDTYMSWGGLSDPSAVDALLSALKNDVNSEVRMTAALALTSSGSGNAMGALIESAMHDEDENVRATAVLALARLKNEDPSLVGGVLLTAAYEDKSELVRGYAGEVLFTPGDPLRGRVAFK